MAGSAPCVAVAFSVACVSAQKEDIQQAPGLAESHQRRRELVLSVKAKQRICRDLTALLGLRKEFIPRHHWRAAVMRVTGQAGRLFATNTSNRGAPGSVMPPCWAETAEAGAGLDGLSELGLNKQLQKLQERERDLDMCKQTHLQVLERLRVGWAQMGLPVNSDDGPEHEKDLSWSRLDSLGSRIDERRENVRSILTSLMSDALQMWSKFGDPHHLQGKAESIVRSSDIAALQQLESLVASTRAEVVPRVMEVRNQLEHMYERISLPREFRLAELTRSSWTMKDLAEAEAALSTIRCAIMAGDVQADASKQGELAMSQRVSNLESQLAAQKLELEAERRKVEEVENQLANSKRESEQLAFKLAKSAERLAIAETASGPGGGKRSVHITMDSMKNEESDDEDLAIPLGPSFHLSKSQHDGSSGVGRTIEQIEQFRAQLHLPQAIQDWLGLLPPLIREGSSRGKQRWRRAMELARRQGLIDPEGVQLELEAEELEAEWKSYKVREREQEAMKERVLASLAAAEARTAEWKAKLSEQETEERRGRAVDATHAIQAIAKAMQYQAEVAMEEERVRNHKTEMVAAEEDSSGVQRSHTVVQAAESVAQVEQSFGQAAEKLLQVANSLWDKAESWRGEVEAVGSQLRSLSGDLKVQQSTLSQREERLREVLQEQKGASASCKNLALLTQARDDVDEAEEEVKRTRAQKDDFSKIESGLHTMLAQEEVVQATKLLDQVQVCMRGATTESAEARRGAQEQGKLVTGMRQAMKKMLASDRGGNVEMRKVLEDAEKDQQVKDERYRVARDTVARVSAEEAEAKKMLQQAQTRWDEPTQACLQRKNSTNEVEVVRAKLVQIEDSMQNAKNQSREAHRVWKESKRKVQDCQGRRKRKIEKNLDSMAQQLRHMSGQAGFRVFLEALRKTTRFWVTELAPEYKQALQGGSHGGQQEGGQQLPLPQDLDQEIQNLDKRLTAGCALVDANDLQAVSKYLHQFIRKTSEHAVEWQKAREQIAKTKQGLTVKRKMQLMLKFRGALMQRYDSVVDKLHLHPETRAMLQRELDKAETVDDVAQIKEMVERFESWSQMYSQLKDTPSEIDLESPKSEIPPRPASPKPISPKLSKQISQKIESGAKSPGPSPLNPFSTTKSPPRSATGSPMRSGASPSANENAPKSPATPANENVSKSPTKSVSPAPANEKAVPQDVKIGAQELSQVPRKEYCPSDGSGGFSRTRGPENSEDVSVEVLSGVRRDSMLDGESLAQLSERSITPLSESEWDAEIEAFAAKNNSYDSLIDELLPEMRRQGVNALPEES